jgi:chromosome segregation ATPase
MCKEQDRLQERLRTAELGCDANHRLAEANAGWCDDLVDLLRDASREYKDKHHWAQFWHNRAEDMRMERDELQEKCDRLKAKVEHQREQLAVYATMCDFDAIRALKRERNEHKHRADNAEGHVKSLERRLDAAHETYCALLNDAAREFRALTEERDELQASLRKIAERAGVPHDSEFDEYSDETVIGATLAQIDSTRGYVGALEWQRDRQKKMLDEYDQTHVELPKDANGEYIHIGDRVEDNERVVRIVLTNGSWEPSVYIEKAPCLLEEHFCCEVSHYHEPTVEQVIRDLTLGKITESQAIERIEGINGQC